MARMYMRTIGAVVAHIRRQLIAGLVIAAPLVVTYLLLRFIFVNLDDLLEPAFARLLGRSLPGAGVAALIILLYLAGLLATNIIGRALIHRGEGVLLSIPIVKEIYGPARQTVQAMSQAGKAFRRVVLVSWPSKGIKTVAFETGTYRDVRGRDFTLVFIPNTPLPTSGFIALFPAEEVEDAGISVDAALRLVVSGGVVSAKEGKSLPSR